MADLIQCMRCKQWFVNKRGLLQHMRWCDLKYASLRDDANHIESEYQPLKSCYNNDEHLLPFNLYDHIDEYSSDDSELSDGELSLSEDEDNINMQEDNSGDYHEEMDQNDHVNSNSTAVSKVQIRLNDLINRHKAPLKMYDDIVTLFNEYMSSPNFSKHVKLKHRHTFLKRMEVANPSLASLRPVNKQVTLHDNSRVTVPVFDAKAMIMDILTNPVLMKKENFAQGYDIFSGDVDITHSANSVYGEIHTGDEWIPARNKFCKTHDNTTKDMPIALVIFGDKSHTDLHGALSLTPIIFTLTLFNQKCRNDPQFWRVLGYVPNLGYGKNKSNKTPTVEKVQDEHNCLSCVFESLRVLHKRGGFRASVLNTDVHIKVWIHFFIGDTEGNNKWLGHYSGNKSTVKRPYRDCSCNYMKMSHTNPRCVYTTMDEMRQLNTLKRKRNQDDYLERFKAISRYPITNALTKKYMPLSDTHHGPYCMMPPELLHTSGSGLIKYMFQSMQWYIGETQLRDDIDKMHVRIYSAVKRQSERDLPRGSIRNGIIDDTKCQSEERKGNLFLLLCIANTTLGGENLKKALRYDDREWNSWIRFVKLYLSMEEWLHDSNPKEEVDRSRNLIAKVLSALQALFPRPRGNGYNIPKMHGMTKFQFFIKRYGTAMNFYGGTGESAHKLFVKAPGQKTQRRVSEFASQVATQHHNMIVTANALRTINSDVTLVRNCNEMTNVNIDHVVDDDEYIDDDLTFRLSGQYSLCVSHNLIEMESVGEPIYPKWKTNKYGVKDNNYKYSLHPRLVKAIIKYVSERNIQHGLEVPKIDGYTRLTSVSKRTGERIVYHANPHIQGRMWYDWALVHFEETDRTGKVRENYYPSRILGFINRDRSADHTAIVQCTERPLDWSQLEKNFLMKVALGVDDEINVVSVPITSLVHPLCVIPDYGGDGNSYVVVLPRRNWSRYFGNRIT